MVNKQDGVASNLGDVLKHSAVVRMADLLLRHSDRRVRYVESNAYVLTTRCPNPNEWQRLVGVELSRTRALGCYVDAEAHSIARGEYRCSGGLVFDRLGPRRAQTVLCESDLATRAKLVAQISDEMLGSVVIFADWHDLAQVSVPPVGDSLLALVDPFSVDEDLLNTVGGALARLCSHGQDAVVQAFTYSRRRHQWSGSMGGVFTLAATMSRRPYFNAIYTSDSIRSAAQAEADLLGWSRVP